MNVQKIRLKLLLLLGLCLHWIPSRRGKYYNMVIVRVDAIGDYVLFMNALWAYKEKLKGKKVLLICADLVKPLAESESLYSDILTFNRNKFASNFIYNLSFLKKVRSISSDEVVYPLLERHSTGDIIIANIRSEKKFAVRNNENTGVGRMLNNIYTRLVEMPANVSEMGSTDLFTREIINPTFHYHLNKITVHGDKSLPLDLPSNYAVIAISSSANTKIWPADRFAALIDLIPNDYNIVLSGAGDADVKRAETIISNVKDRSRICNMVNKTSVYNMFLLISGARFVIGNDSAAVHIAAASHVPSICLFQGAHFGRFLPYPEAIGNTKYHPRIVYYKMDCYNCNFKCKWPDSVPFPCLDKVSVDMAADELSKLLIELKENEREN